MISAVVLAAGLSTRMGRPKLLLPWGSTTGGFTTVIGQVVATLVQAGLDEVVVVTGAMRAEVEAEVQKQGWVIVRTVFNPLHAQEDMLVSLKTGLAVLDQAVNAMLVVLGDQPQMEVGVVRSLLGAYRTKGHSLIVPSFQMHRGHPWLVARALWPALLSAPKNATMRDFLIAYPQQITYLPVTTSSILSDLDTPEDYARGLDASQNSR